MSAVYMDRARLKEDIKAAEGCVLHAYEDHRGFLTIGYGRLIDARKNGGISPAEADFLLDNDLDRVTTEIHGAIPWLKYAPDPVQRALCEMAFQLGVGGLLGFEKMLEAVNQRDYRKAAGECLDSRWAREQTPGRAKRIADMIGSA